MSVTTQANNNLNDQGSAISDLADGNFTINHLQIANLTLNSVLTPTLINQATAGFQYWNNLIDSKTRAPLFTFPLGGNQIEFGTNANVPQQSIQRKYQFKDDVSKVGKHTFKGGFDYIWTPFMGGFFEFNPTLEIDYGLLPSQILALPQGFQTPGLVQNMQIATSEIFEHRNKALGWCHRIRLQCHPEWSVMSECFLQLANRTRRICSAAVPRKPGNNYKINLTFIHFENHPQTHR